jgi:uncharacterized protein (DUF433 family)
MTTKTKIATPTPHIWLDETGRAWIDETNVEVTEVVVHKLVHRLTPDDIYEGNDRYLSLAQIHAALSYYYDHKAEFDAVINA